MAFAFAELLKAIEGVVGDMVDMTDLLGDDAKSSAVDGAPDSRIRRDVSTLRDESSPSALASDSQDISSSAFQKSRYSTPEKSGPAHDQTASNTASETPARVDRSSRVRVAPAPRSTVVAPANSKRTMVVFSPTNLANEKSKTFDAAQSVISAAQLLGVDVVVVQPTSGRAQATERSAVANQGRRLDVQVGNKQELRSALRLVIAGERINATSKPLPPTTTFVVIGPSTGIAKDALAAIDEAITLESPQYASNVVVVEPDYLTVTDTHELSKRNRLPAGELHQLERNAYTPADARALTQANVLVGDAADRMAIQAAQRLSDGHVADLKNVPILKGANLGEDATPEQILAAVEARSIKVSPVSHEVAVRLSEGREATREDMAQLRPYGKALTEVGLVAPLQPALEQMGIEQTLAGPADGYTLTA